MHARAEAARAAATHVQGAAPAATAARGAPRAPRAAAASAEGAAAAESAPSAADVARLHELYIGARVREAQQRKQLDDRGRAEAAIRGKLGGVDAARVEAACRAGFDGFSTLLGEVFGEKAWEELLNNVPDSWEEDEAIRSIADILRRPAVSETVWLLLPAQAVP